MQPGHDLSNDIETLKREVVEWSRYIGAGNVPDKIHASIQIGLRLRRIKERTPTGKFSAVKIAQGLSDTTAWRCMRLSERFPTCGNLEEVKDYLRTKGLYSVRKVYDSFDLLQQSTPAAAKPEPAVRIDEAEPVALCRIHGNYLTRLTLEGQPAKIGPRCEVSLETKDPREAVRRRDFLFRVFDKMGLLTERGKAQWLALQSDVEHETHIHVAPIHIIQALVREVKTFNMVEEFGQAYQDAVDWMHN